MRYQRIWVSCVTARIVVAEEPWPGVVTTDAVDYEVKMTTTLVVPVSNPSIDVLRVWHALPTPRPWSVSSRRVGASNIKASAGGIQQYNQRHNSHHIYWQLAVRQNPGTNTFTTRFVVRSLQREFQPEKVHVGWQDYLKPVSDPTARVNPGGLPSSIHGSRR